MSVRLAWVARGALMESWLEARGCFTMQSLLRGALAHDVDGLFGYKH
jgi:hypothetical protein